MSLGCLGVLGLAAGLRPATDGHGTHEQLGLRACPWITGLDTPCPTCGMTTAFSHAAEAQFVAGFFAQPLGLLMAIATATVFWGALHVALTGSSLGVVASKAIRPRVLWFVGGLALAAWAFKMLTWNPA